MARYEEILEKSGAVDQKWSQVRTSDLASERISFPVPITHTRHLQIQGYVLEVDAISKYQFGAEDIVIVDSNLSLTADTSKASLVLSLTPDEKVLKSVERVDEIIESLQLTGKRISAIGGGIILNVASYIAEKLSLDLIYFPSTIIAMSDSSIGGKVRLNRIEGGEHRKNAYKSVYEPSHIIVDPAFLDSLTTEQIKTGLAEVIKHAVYQSRPLGEYLLSEEFQPFTDKESLLKAILWTADLKRICIEVDPEEEPGGATLILRAAHDISSQLEEESGFTLSHGEAVIQAMVKDTKENQERRELLARIYEKLEISVAAD